jgi:hypothetical protein
MAYSLGPEMRLRFGKDIRAGEIRGDSGLEGVKLWTIRDRTIRDDSGTIRDRRNNPFDWARSANQAAAVDCAAILAPVQPALLGGISSGRCEKIRV